MRQGSSPARLAGAVALGLWLAWGSAPAAVGGQPGGWQLVSSKNGIDVYRQDDDAQRIKRFRGVTRLPLKNPAAVEALVNDYAAAPRWAHFISSATELSRGPYGNRRVRYLTALPWPLSDRDVIATVTLTMSSNTLVVVVEDDPKAPANPDYLRMPDLYGRLQVTFHPETHDADVVYEATVDPGGVIPAWVANIVLKDAPYFTLLKLGRLAADAPYATYRSPAFTYPW